MVSTPCDASTVAQLSASRRARLPATAFAYVDSKGRRRLPINDEAHVRNALARFNQVTFEDDAAKERARRRLLTAARKYGIVPIGFMSGQLRTQQGEAAAGRLVVELGQIGSVGELEDRLRAVLHDATLVVLHWSKSVSGYLDRGGAVAALPGDGDGRAVTLLEHRGQPMTALVHDPGILKDREVVKTVTAAVRLAVENQRLLGEVEARTIDARTLPAGIVTFLLTDIEGSTLLLRRLGDRYGALLADVRAILRTSVDKAGGREIDARADEFFAVFERAPAALEAALAIQRALRGRAWPDAVEVRLRIGIHTGQPSLTDTGYVGLAVHTVARVSSAAHGGQILLSGSVVEELERVAPAGIGFRSVGAHQLHGLAEPIALFQLEADGLATDFPPPRLFVAPKREGTDG